VQSDVYALGVTAYELISGEVPWSGYTADDVRRMVLCGQRPLMHSRIPNEVARIISDCWHQNPAFRPTADEVVQRLGVVVAGIPHAEAARTSTSRINVQSPVHMVHLKFMTDHPGVFSVRAVDREKLTLCAWDVPPMPHAGAGGGGAGVDVDVGAVPPADAAGRAVLQCIAGSSDANRAALVDRVSVRSIEVAWLSQMRCSSFFQRVSVCARA
jgi:hypothetical protein